MYLIKKYENQQFLWTTHLSQSRTDKWTSWNGHEKDEEWPFSMEVYYFTPPFPRLTWQFSPIAPNCICIQWCSRRTVEIKDHWGYGRVILPDIPVRCQHRIAWLAWSRQEDNNEASWGIDDVPPKEMNEERGNGRGPYLVVETTPEPINESRWIHVTSCQDLKSYEVIEKTRIGWNREGLILWNGD